MTRQGASNNIPHNLEVAQGQSVSFLPTVGASEESQFFKQFIFVFSVFP